MKKLLLLGLAVAAPLLAGCHRYVYVHRDAYVEPCAPARHVYVDPAPPVVVEECWAPRVVVVPPPCYPVYRPHFSFGFGGWGWGHGPGYHYGHHRHCR